MAAGGGRLVVLTLEHLEVSGNKMTATSFSIKDFFKSFMLVELFKGMALTGRYAFARKVTLQYPE